MAEFQPVPTYADPVLTAQDPKTGKVKSIFNPTWLSWFLQLTNGGLGGITQHDSLAGLQGGASGQYYHLTAAEHSSVNFRGTGPVAVVALGASPFTYQNPHTYDIDIFVNGGTVTKLEFSRDNVTFYKYAVAADTGSVRLSPGDYVVVTYAVAPVVSEVPR